MHKRIRSAPQAVPRSAADAPDRLPRRRCESRSGVLRPAATRSPPFPSVGASDGPEGPSTLALAVVVPGFLPVGLRLPTGALDPSLPSFPKQGAEGRAGLSACRSLVGGLRFRSDLSVRSRAAWLEGYRESIASDLPQTMQDACQLLPCGRHPRASVGAVRHCSANGSRWRKAGSRPRAGRTDKVCHFPTPTKSTACGSSQPKPLIPLDCRN
jgi:hypothetical protein